MTTAEPKPTWTVCWTLTKLCLWDNTMQHTCRFAEAAVLASLTVIAFRFHGRGEKECHNANGTRSQGCNSAYVKVPLSGNTGTKSCLIWGKHGISPSLLILRFSKEIITKVCSGDWCGPLLYKLSFLNIRGCLQHMEETTLIHHHAIFLHRERGETKERTW